MSPLLAESMSHAAFSMNQAARRNATGIRRLPRALSMRPSMLRRFGCGASAPTVDNATTLAGFALASAAHSGLMNPMASGKPTVRGACARATRRSEEPTSELQPLINVLCRLLPEKIEQFDQRV